jgi:predicted ArsR family transcriptional regulator
MRLFHLTDLPSDLIFVYLEENFRKEFLIKLKTVFGTYQKMAEFVGYTDTGIIETFRVKNRFTELSTIIKLANFLSKRGYSNFDPKKIEKKIVAYRGIGTSLIIRDPNFPLKEDERMIRIFFHLLGDGYGGKYGYGGGKPFYRNYNRELLDEFEADLKVFGEVPHIKRETIVEIPKVIGYILKHIYKTDFESHKSFIPSVIFKLSSKLIAQGIKAFADDEASVDDCRIRFYSSNKKLLAGIRNLMIKKFPEFSGKIGQIEKKKAYLRGKKFINYSLPIFSEGLIPYYNLISFSHPEKLESLKRIFGRKTREWARRHKSITKLLILQSLKDKNKTVKEISKEVGITGAIVRAHFEGSKSNAFSLRKMGFAENVGFTKTKAKIWSITAEGLKYLKENEDKIDKFSIEGNISKSYLDLVKKSKWITPSEVAKRRNCRNDTARKQLLKLYRNGYLRRNRIGKEDYKYRLTKDGIRFLIREKILEEAVNKKLRVNQYI